MTRRPAGDFELERARRLGVGVRRLREERGLTQEALARQADLSVNTVQKLEQGSRHSPEFFTVGSIAKVLAVPVDSLYTLAHAAPSRES